MKSAPTTSTHSRAARLDLRRADRQRRQEARAGGVDVDRAGAGGAQLVRDQRRGVRHQLVAGERGDDHEVELGGGDAGALERLAAGGGGDVGQAARRSARAGARGCRCACRSSRRPCRCRAATSSLPTLRRGRLPPTPSIAAPRSDGGRARRRPRSQQRVLRHRLPPAARRDSASASGTVRFDEAGEHRAGTGLDEALDALRAQREQRLAPAHRLRERVGEPRAHVVERLPS